MYIVSLIVITALTLHALYTDLKRMEIENYTCIIGAVYSIIITLIGFNSISIKECLIGGAVAFVMFFIIPIEGGDMKFLTFIGFFFGIKMFLAIAFLMYLFACVAGIPYAIKARSLKAKMPMMLGIAPAVLLALYLPGNLYFQRFLIIFHLF